MDESRFDAFSRAVAQTRSRRGLTRLLGGLAVGDPLGLLHRPETAAKGKKHKKRKPSPAAPPSPPSPPPCPAGQRLCRGTCSAVTHCCIDGDCADGKTCQQGTCACPADKPHLCAGSPT